MDYETFKKLKIMEREATYAKYFKKIKSTKSEKGKYNQFITISILFKSKHELSHSDKYHYKRNIIIFVIYYNKSNLVYKFKTHHIFTFTKYFALLPNFNLNHGLMVPPS